MNIRESSPLQNWTAAHIPPQAGRLAVVTGGTGGLGYETALALARAGADVIVAGRNETKGREALGRIRSLAPGVLTRFESLDLGNLKSVAEFAGRLAAAERPVDLLINNAGVVGSGARQVTMYGFEMHFGVNYLGHFALTARLLPLLQRSRQPRVVQLSSRMHRRGTIHLEDLQLERGYGLCKAYRQSKLAALMFALELQRLSDANGWGLRSVAAHPGCARTDLLAKGMGAGSLALRMHRAMRGLVGQSAAEGALPVLFAATAFEAEEGGHYGPGGPFELVGAPGMAKIGSRARDAWMARMLWAASERLTGVVWPGE